MMTFATGDAGDSHHDKSVGCKIQQFAGRIAPGAVSEPEFRDAERNGIDLSRIDGEALPEQVAGELAVRGNLAARTEDAEAADRQTFQRSLRFVDLGAVHRH